MLTGCSQIFLYFVQVVLVIFGQEIDVSFQWMVCLLSSQHFNRLAV